MKFLKKQKLKFLNSIYNEISSNYTYEAPLTNSQKKTTTIKSNSSFITSIEISNQIAEEFINLRNFYTE